jgi:hypothetical protein
MMNNHKQVGWKVTWIKCNRIISITYELSQEGEARDMTVRNKGIISPVYEEKTK